MTLRCQEPRQLFAGCKDMFNTEKRRNLNIRVLASPEFIDHSESWSCETQLRQSINCLSFDKAVDIFVAFIAFEAFDDSWIEKRSTLIKVATMTWKGLGVGPLVIECQSAALKWIALILLLPFRCHCYFKPCNAICWCLHVLCVKLIPTRMALCVIQHTTRGVGEILELGKLMGFQKQQWFHIKFFFLWQLFH